MSVPPAWSTQQLAEFLAAVSAVEDHAAAGRVGAERAAEALEAEVAAIVRDGAVEAAVGYPTGLTPVDELVAVATGAQETIELPGAGTCRACVSPLDGTRTAWLVVGRLGEEGFSRDETVLARSMARVLALTQRGLAVLDNERALRERSERQAAENARLLAEVRKRQVLLERLSAVQRSIVRRADREQVLDRIVGDVCELTGEAVAFLRLIDPEDDGMTFVAAERGLGNELSEALARRPLHVGISGACIAEDRVVVANEYAADDRGTPAMAEQGIRAAMAAPVRRQGNVVGSLMVASMDAERDYGEEDREVLVAFAENASIALTDAAMVDAAFHQAFHDSLTGLPNRAAFLDRMNHALAIAERGGAQVGVLFLDVDRFKTVNDSLGHRAGDELLIAVSERLRSCLRPGDTAARLGGDEFAILLEGIRVEDEASLVATRVLGELRGPFSIQGREVTVSASVGIATGTSRQDDVLRNADLAMYSAKEGGRDRQQVFEPGMHEALVEQIELEAELRRAVDGNEFVVHYQPIVDLGTGGIVGLEALVRWEHPERGTMPPGAFIPLAEETHLIVPIGRHVLREACRRAADWTARHGRLTVSVNLSAAQLSHPGLVRDVADALRDSELSPTQLILEITETVLMDDPESNALKLRELKRLGVRLAVDDFGTGYSSLTYLRDFPLDVLKVDKSFVDGLGVAPRGMALARAIVDVGAAMALAVVGEGIERGDQRARLLELGCPLGQGFFFARPAEPAMIDALLGERGVTTDAAVADISLTEEANVPRPQD